MGGAAVDEPVDTIFHSQTTAPAPRVQPREPGAGPPTRTVCRRPSRRRWPPCDATLTALTVACCSRRLTPGSLRSLPREVSRPTASGWPRYRPALRLAMEGHHPAGSPLRIQEVARRMCYREKLPPDCPPPQAEEITAPREVYRLVSTAPPTVDDFKSLRALKPDGGPFPEALDECRAHGLSVETRKKAAYQKRKLPNLRDRQLVCRVRLVHGAGSIQRTGKSHHTWWPLAKFDILTNSHVEDS